MPEQDPTTQSAGIYPFLPIGVLIVLHLSVALPLAYFLNVWVDEGSTLFTTQSGLFDALRNAGRYEKQAPLYFWLLSLWRELDSSIFFARVFSILCSVGAIAVFYAIARRLFPRNAFYVTTFFALHPFLVWASVEARVYSMVVLISVVLSAIYISLYVPVDEQPDARTKKSLRVLFVLSSVIALYTNYYLGFILASGFVGLLALREWRSAKQYFGDMIIVGLFCLPLAWMVSSQLAGYDSIYHTEKSLVTGLKTLWGHALTFILPTEVFGLEGGSTWSVVRLWAVRFGLVALAVMLIRDRKILKDEAVIYLGSVVTVVCGFMLAAYLIMGSEFVEIRHAAVMFVPILLLAATVVLKTVPKPGVPVIGAIAVVFIIYGLTALFPSGVKRGDWENVGRYIENQELASQPILIFRGYDALAFNYHYSGVNQVIPSERFFDWGFEDAPFRETTFKAQINHLISQIPEDSKELWVLTDDTCQDSAMSRSCIPLERYLSERYSVEIEKVFFKERVRFFRRRQ